MELLRIASLTLIILSTLGCGMTFRPTHPARIESAEADIDVVEARMGSVGTLSGGGLSVEVGLRTRMPLGARLRQLMFVSARLRPCSGVGLTASTIRLDGAEDDAGTSIDVAGEHLLRATFTGAGTEMLAGPVALDWYDDVNGERRCGRIALVDSEPQHAWTNESRWSLGVGFRGVLPLTPVGHVDGILDAPALVRYRTSERGALIGTLGLIGVSMCRSSLCSKTSTGADKGGATIPIGVGYDYTLVHAGRFAMGLGARYESRLTWVALRTGTNAILIHELSAVPRLAIVGPRRFPSGLPGTSHGTSLDLELPVGVWAGDQMRDTSLVLGGALSLHFTF